MNKIPKWQEDIKRIIYSPALTNYDKYHQIIKMILNILKHYKKIWTKTENKQPHLL